MITYIENNTFIAEFKANELKTERQFINVFWEAFNLPYTDEIHTFDQLNDWMRDFSWLPYTSFRVKVMGYVNYIQKGYPLDFLKNTLLFYKEYWEEKGYEFEIELN